MNSLRCFRFNAFLTVFGVSGLGAQEIVFTPDAPGGLYAVGARVGWTLRQNPAQDGLGFMLKRNGSELVASGAVTWRDGVARIETAAVDEPEMLRLEITPADGKVIAQAGAAVAPARLTSDVARPPDFDAFWAGKLRGLQSIPAAPVLTSGESGRAGVTYATVTLASIRGARVHGQIARPEKAGKFPAMLILQWAGGPYPLQKNWVTDRAAEGWLALNIEPHDVPADLPKEFYDALPRLLKDYQTIGDTDRERSYFLAMFLGAWRAADYLTTREDWDGRTLLVMGASMGGMQAFSVAALHPRVTHLIAHTPAGCDALAALHSRAAGYPNWNAVDPRVAATAPYFDPVNFASRIRVPALVSMGFVDTTTPPAGIWLAINQLAGPKEAVPMPETPHGHLAKPGQEKAYNDRRDAWLSALVAGREPEVRANAF